MINVLYVSHSSDLDGAARTLLTLLQHVDRHQVNPVVIVPSQGPLLDEIKKLSVKHVILAIPHWFRRRRSLSTERQLGTSGERDLACVETEELLKMTQRALMARLEVIGSIIKEHSINVVHTNTVTILEGGLASRIARIKHLWHIHEFIDGHPSLIPFLPSSAVSWLLGNLADRVLVPSHSLYRAYSNIAKEYKIKQIYNGIVTTLNSEDIAVGRSETRRSYETEFGISPSHHLICTVGNGWPEKGWADLVEACYLLSQKRNDFNVVLVGYFCSQADYFRILSERVKELGIGRRLFFVGRRDDAHRIMMASDIVFQPSRMESFSLVAGEAMSLSLPVVGTMCGGMGEVIIHNETGLLTQPGDYQGMASALDFLLSNPEERARMGEKGRQVFLRNFDPAGYAQRVVKLYREIVMEESREQQVTSDGYRGIGGLYASISSLVMQADLVRSELESMKKSKSWRLTAPLRKAQDWLYGIRRKP